MNSPRVHLMLSVWHGQVGVANGNISCHSLNPVVINRQIEATLRLSKALKWVKLVGYLIGEIYVAHWFPTLILLPVAPKWLYRTYLDPYWCTCLRFRCSHWVRHVVHPVGTWFRPKSGICDARLLLTPSSRDFVEGLYRKIIFITFIHILSTSTLPLLSLRSTRGASGWDLVPT